MHSGTDNTGVNTSFGKIIRWAEWTLAASFLVVLLIIHIILLLHSGGLWRDEATTVNISKLPLGEMWNQLAFDSIPALWFLLLKFWRLIGLEETDLALRTLGLIVGLGLLGAIWGAARSLGMRLPLIALALFAMCPTALAGDALRANGLGTISILLALAAMWRVLERPTPWRMAVCAGMFILCVQCLYNNAVLIFAIGTGAAAVGLYRRNWKLTLFPIGAGLLAALSLLPYLSTFAIVQDYNIIRTSEISFSWILDKLHSAVAPSGLLIALVWDALAIVTVMILARQWFHGFRDNSNKETDLSLFLLVTLIVGVVAYFAFIKTLALPTQSWYYLPLMALVIIIIDKGVDFLCRKSAAAGIVRIVFALLMAFFVFTGLWNEAHVRRTNMDLLADKLETLADKNDLILITAFYYAVSFDRYYKGSTAWVTLPNLSDHKSHRYDLLKGKMTQTEPIRDVLDKIKATLQNGRRVWVLGPLSFPRPGQIPLELPPAPNSYYGWSEGAYQHAWSVMAGAELQNYGRTLERIFIPEENPVSKFENLQLLVIAR